MRQLLLFLLFFSSLYSAISEFKTDDYQIIIGQNFDDEALDIVEDHNYDISIIGYTQDFKTTTNTTQSFDNAFDYLRSITSHNGEQLRLIRLDQAAKVVNDVNFKLANFNRGNNIVKSADNGYHVGGYTHNGQMILASLNTQGKTNYVKQFGTANFDKLSSLIRLRDGSSVVIGTSQTSRNTKDDIFAQGLGKDDIFLAKFRSDGQLIWEKKFGSIEDDTGIDAVSSDDGGVICIGLSQVKGEPQLMAMKISDTGNATWTQEFSKLGRQKAFKIIKMPDGNYLISASFENKNGQDNIRLIKIDSTGKTLWEKDFYKDANEQLNDMVIDLKGNIMGVGHTQTKGRSDKDALVRYYDAHANPLWERKFGKERQDAFKSLSLLHDNSFALAGFSNSFANKARQIWVLKLNDDGTLVKRQMHKALSLYEALKKEFKADKQVHIYKDLHIAHDGLIFKQGSSILTPKHKSVLEEFIPRLAKILLLYQNTIKNLQINGFTSTEWNAPKTQRYLNNAHLSNDRAMHILDYAYALKEMTKYQEWLSRVLSTDGYSYSNLIYADKKENKVRSRRVEFEIRLK